MCKLHFNKQFIYRGFSSHGTITRLVPLQFKDINKTVVLWMELVTSGTLTRNLLVYFYVSFSDQSPDQRQTSPFNFLGPIMCSTLWRTYHAVSCLMGFHYQFS